MGNLINNAKWSSSMDGRLSNDDVCIEVQSDFQDGSVEIHLEFDAQEQAIIKLSEEQKRQLISKLSVVAVIKLT